jgi:hypothetical protein
MTTTPDPMDDEALRALSHAAYDHFDAGRLDAAAAAFATLATADPTWAPFPYMLGLAHKYRRDWAASLRANQRSQDLRDAVDESSVWNAGIAATGLGDHVEARRQWAKVGITIPDGPAEANFGTACVRLNPWADGEVVWVRRLGPCHARLLSVPYPESGWRFADVVLHDGAATGRRRDGQDHEVAVFNAMQRLQTSPFRTFTVFVTVPDAESLAPLLATTAPGLGHVEDWTASVRVLCRRCSYGIGHIHRHDHDAMAWACERTLGFAAESRAVVDGVLARWQAPGRVVDGIDDRETPMSSPEDGRVWWLGDDEAAADT